MKLDGNTILITGGSAGIGLAFAKKFSELGNKVIVTGRNQAKLDDATKSVPGLVAIQCDAADPDAVAQLGKTIESEHPETNVLMNNAGVFVFRNLRRAEADLAAMTRELDINVAGSIRTTSALIETLKKNRGTVINVTSGLAWAPIQCAPVYCATKAAMHSYTISLRQQLAEVGVEVIELAPPAVKTEMTSELPEGGDFKIISTDQLIRESIAGLRKGKEEICPGQASQLRFMSRLAPSFIFKQLAKGSKDLIPD